MTSSTTEALGSVLAALRRRARMSQRALSRASGISYTQIGDLENARGYNPSPLTLRALAKGLATDEFLAEGYDPMRADAFYRQLMDAAGYLGGLPIGTSQQEPPTDEEAENAALEFLSSKAGDEDLAAKLLGLARRYPDLSPEEQTAVRHLVEMWSKDA